MTTSLCSQYWQVLLAQAICIGLGQGCLFIPSVAIIHQHFTAKKAFATGLASSGSSLGGVIYPIVFSQLQPIVGFGWATRILRYLTGNLFGLHLRHACPSDAEAETLPRRVCGLQRSILFGLLPLTQETLVQSITYHPML